MKPFKKQFPIASRNSTPDYSSNSSINSNSDLSNRIIAHLQKGVNVNTNNPQLIKPNPKFQMNIKGNNKAWVLNKGPLRNNKSNNRQQSEVTMFPMRIGNRRNILSADPNAPKPNYLFYLARNKGSMSQRSGGRYMTPAERILTKQLRILGKPSMVLYHSSPYSLNNVRVSNIILSPSESFFHTNPNWTYHGNKTKTQYELHIPVNTVKQQAIQSMAEFQPTNLNTTKGYSTLIMPTIKSIVVNIQDTNNGTKKITSVYKRPSYRNKKYKNLV